MFLSCPRRRRKEARPAELVEAALDVFVARGFAATRLDDIAKAAGVSKGTLYLYFPSKEALFKAVIEQAMLPPLAEGEALIAAGEGDPEQLLRDLLLGWWRLVGSTKLSGIPKLVMAEAGNFPEIAQFYYDNVVLRGRAMMVRTLELGIARGVFRSAQPELLCHLAFAPMLFGCMWRDSLAQCDPDGISMDQYVRTHIELFVSGLRQQANLAPLTPPVSDVS